MLLNPISVESITQTPPIGAAKNIVAFRSLLVTTALVANGINVTPGNALAAT